MSETKLEMLQKFKSKPKPILKKNLTTRHRAPVFFSGNEIYPDFSKESDEDSKLVSNCHLDIFTNTQHHKSIYLDNEEDHFGKFQLTHCKPKYTHKRRAQSAVYIFHRREINRQIIKSLLRSTDCFINSFKKSLQADKFNDQEFYRNFKNKLVNGLKDFLLNSDTLFEEYNTCNQIRAALSEPCISEFDKYRCTNKKERIVHQSKSSLNIENAFISANVDIYGKQNENLIYPVSLSLPHSSFLEKYTNQIKLQQNAF